MSVLSDCPYHCTKGKVFMPSLKTFVDCPHCKGLVSKVERTPEQQAEALTLVEALRIPDAYKSAKYTASSFFDVSAQQYFAPESLDLVTRKLGDVINSVYDGQLLNESIYFRVGNHADYLCFVYDALRSAAESGLGALPLLSLSELRALQDGDEKLKTLLRVNYLDYATTPFIVLVATANTNNEGWTALADVLTSREIHGLPTIVFGYWDTNVLSARKSGLDYLLGATSSRLGVLHPVEVKTRNQWDKDQLLLPKQMGVSKANTKKTLVPDFINGITADDLARLEG